MEKTNFKLKDLNNMANLLETKVETIYAVMNLNDGSKMTTTLSILRTGGFALLNLSNCKTLKFKNDEELDSYIAKKFEVFESDKDMYQTFTGMDDETWEEWNK